MCDSPCEKAIDSPKRLGRAHYVCQECGLDVSLLLALVAELEAGDELLPIQQR